MWSNRAREIFEKLEPVANKMGLRIVDMDLPTGMNGIFRIYLECLDRDKKITVDECAKFSPVVSDFLDAGDYFSFRYYLEVSSPGLDRPVRRWEDLVMSIGKTLKIKLSEPVDGRKRMTGVLKSVSDEKEEFTVDVGGTEVTVAKGFVKKINEIWKGEK